MMKRFKPWWQQDQRYRTFTQAVLMALLPVLCCFIRCALDGEVISGVWLPASEWNDELFYYKQVEGIIGFGYPQGYFGFNESHAMKLSFAAWSPVLVFPWILWGFLFGWNLLSPIVCNIVLMSAACFLFVWLVKPGWKQLGVLALLFSLFTPFTRYMLSGMPEVICFSMLILFYGVAFSYLSGKKTGKLVLMFVMAAVMTLMRPYLLLFLLLPAYFWVRRSGLRGAMGSAAVMAATLGVYAWIKHYLGAEYFAPLFFTDWVDAFFERGVFGGIRFFLGKLYYMGKGFFGHTIQGLRTGLASGAFFAGYIVVLGVLLIQSLLDWRRLRRMRAAEEDSIASDPEGQEARRGLYGRLIIQIHLALSFLAMFFALLLMYKLTEGSKHLLTFITAGIFVIAMMDTRFFKKAVLLGVAFVYLYSYMAVDPYDYGVPYLQAEREEQMAEWDEIFQRKLRLESEGEMPSYDNAVIWVFQDEYADGVLPEAGLFPEGGELSEAGELTGRNVDWQLLYVLPEGFGVSCCMPEYVIENFDSLQCKYLATLSGGRIDEMCLDAGYREIGRDRDMVVYALR